jgi:hypothetical protein
MSAKRRKQPIPDRQTKVPPLSSFPPQAGVMQIQLGYDPKGPSESVDIVSSKDGWSEYTLADETVIRTKAAVLDVKKMTDQFNADGEPIYVLQLTMINQAKVPDHLKKKKE